MKEILVIYLESTGSETGRLDTLSVTKSLHPSYWGMNTMGHWKVWDETYRTVSFGNDKEFGPSSEGSSREWWRQNEKQGDGNEVGILV